MSDDYGSPPTFVLKPSRLVSLDAFRGFVMFWIVGGEAIAHALAGLRGVESTVLNTVVLQLSHVEWEGFRFYDLIFPSFVFIVGTSLVFSLSKLTVPGDRRDATWRVVKRGLLLWLIGIIYYGGISKGWYDAGTHEGVRLLGVLQRIGICYLVTGLLFIYVPWRGLVAAFLVLLAGYWALLTFVAVPGQDSVSFEEGRNYTNWFDSQYLPFFKWKVAHDPEGILSTFPAIATCLLGVFAGLLLKGERMSRGKKCGLLLVAGVALIFLGTFMGQYHPVIKNLWTSSFVLVAGGWSLVVLGVFYLVVDWVGFKGWAMPFVWIGMNPIMIYLLSSVVNFDEIAARVLGGPMKVWVDGMVPGLGALLIALAGMGIVLLLCRYLYKKEVFFRI
ncbi:MAG: putative acyltransferase [Akkermansiaceae bacterium]|jgi:predicted acyltransferase